MFPEGIPGSARELLVERVRSHPLESDEFSRGDWDTETTRAVHHLTGAGTRMETFHEGSDATVLVDRQSRDVITGF